MWFALFDVTVLLVATVGILVEKNSKLKIKPLKKRADIQNGPLLVTDKNIRFWRK